MSIETIALVTRRARSTSLIDISPRVHGSSPVWAGDTAFASHRVMDQALGASCNVTTITTTVHVGAHADAPLHFDPSGPDAASLELEPYVGRARVVRMTRKGGVTLQDVKALDLAGVERLLIATRVEGGARRFSDPFAYLEPDAAEHLGRSGLVLLGIDTFSVDHRDSKTLASHHALWRGGCLILEGLELARVTPGDYELIALPLKLAGCDASPVRAVLRELPGTFARKGGLPRQGRGRAREIGSRDKLPDSQGGPVSVPCLHQTVDLRMGDTIRVTLDGPANVMLLDDDEFDAYSAGDEYSYQGGWATQSPFEMEAPSDGRWNIVIDAAGEERPVSARVEVIR